VYFINSLGYDINHKQWYKAGTSFAIIMLIIGQFTTILAGFQFCLRVLLLEHCLPMEKRDDISERAVNPMPIFLQAHHEWLVEGEPTPFNYIHKLLNYGYIIGKDMATRPRVRWSHDNKWMYFDGQGFEIARWKQFVRDLLDIAEEMMSKRLFFGAPIPVTDLYSIVDNISKSDAGHYFALDEEDAFSKKRKLMLERLYKSEDYEWLIENMGDELVFIRAGVDEYLKWDEKFRVLLVILFVLTCGQTGRGREMTSLLYMNTMETDRHILIEDGRFMLITIYHKSMAVMDEVRVETIFIFTDIRLFQDFYRIVSINR